MSPREFIEIFVRPEEREMIWLDHFNDSQLLVLRNILERAWTTKYSSDDAKVATISEIKYDGRVVILDDDTRWEVAEFDASTVSMWTSFDRVVIIDDEMFKLDDFEKASVTEDS